MRTGISAEEARAIVLEAARALPAETVLAGDALGRVLAEAVHSSRTLPPADVSAMDGWALRAEDVAGATAQQPARLRVGFEVAAGASSPPVLSAGIAARIFTGAPVPPGADTVVRQEDTERAGDDVLVRVAAPRGTDIREAGEDVRAGELVLPAGARIGPAEIGMLASLGRTVVAVHRRPRVAILSGGDELVEPDGDVAGGRIVASNSWSLAALCREVGADPVYVGIARDTPQALEERLRGALFADVIVSSAGVSVGDHDHVRPVLEKLGGEIVFWGVQIKPGFPFVLARFGERGPLVFGLPGNPVSAMVTFEELVRPALRKMQGHRALFRPVLRARLGHALRKGDRRTHFVRVVVERDGEEWVARTTGSQSSGVLRSMTLANALLVFPSGATELAAGERVDVQVLDLDLLASTGDGLRLA